ncbi:MAG: hypothetical protein RBR53_04940 [Desulforegulaceae bacterium]|nr:hypothetical protein [Desulforegulaceae bacterium]
MEQKKTIIEYKDCIISNKNLTLPRFTMSFEESELVEIKSLGDEISSLFIRGISTLAPLEGKIFFNGNSYDPMDQEKILKLKRNLAYLGPLCALLSNRSLLENILLFRLWEEDLRKINPDKNFIADCEKAGISGFLYKRPEKTTEEIKCGAFLVREFLKNPKIVFMERPYLFTRGRLDRFLLEKLEKVSQTKVPIVYFSNSGFVPSLKVTHKIIIEKEKIEKIKVSNGSDV